MGVPGKAAAAVPAAGIVHTMQTSLELCVNPGKPLQRNAALLKRQLLVLTWRISSPWALSGQQLRLHLRLQAVSSLRLWSTSWEMEPLSKRSSSELAALAVS